MCVWVLDGYAIAAIDAFLTAERLEEGLGVLDELVDAGSVTFPNAVRDEVRASRKGERMESWVRNAANARGTHAAGFEWSVEVINEVPDLCDDDSGQHESASVGVIALAMKLTDDGHEVRLVTEDRVPLPTRMTVFEAAQALQLEAWSLRDFLEEVCPLHWLTD